jgi:hypothetical protein
MKKISFLLAMLAGMAANAQRTTPVTIANTNVDYSTTKTVTFDLSWKGSDANHRDEVWVFVDIQPVTGVNTSGIWSPATLVPSATTVTAGSGNQYSSLTHTAVSGNTRGVWVQGISDAATNTFKATVSVTLADATSAKFNACAYATDYPPNAASYSGGTYTFKGTKPFVVNGMTVSSNQYAVTKITSLTDATGCPGGVGRDVPDNGGTCISGLTAVGGYCRNLAADAASTYVGCNIEIKSADHRSKVYYKDRNVCATGWKVPTFSELKCMWNARTILSIKTDTYYDVYWSSSTSGADGNCTCNGHSSPAYFLNTHVDSCCEFTWNPGDLLYCGNCVVGRTTGWVRCVR